VWLLVLRHWKGAVAALVVVAILGGVLYYGHARYEAGKQQGQVKQLDEDAKLYGQQIAQRDAILQQAQQQLSAAVQLADKYARLSDNLVSQLSALKLQENSALQRVAQVPDTSLFADIRGKLGLLPASSPESFSYGELRALDDKITQLPFALTQIDFLSQQVKAKDAYAGAILEQRDAITKQRDAWITFAAQVEVDYVLAYNALPHHRNWALTILTFGIFGKAKHLNLPNPADLAKQRP
jgi:hypothetical protein